MLDSIIFILITVIVRIIMDIGFKKVTNIWKRSLLLNVFSWSQYGSLVWFTRLLENRQQCYIFSTRKTFVRGKHTANIFCTGAENRSSWTVCVHNGAREITVIIFRRIFASSTIRQFIFEKGRTKYETK